MFENQESTRDEKFKGAAFKVPNHVAELLTIIAEAAGVKPYELFQQMAFAIIRMGQSVTELSPELKYLMEKVRLDQGWQRAFNLCSLSAKMDVAQCILILQQSDKQGPRKGFGLAMIDKPFMGEATVTYNEDKILERVAEVALPDRYRELRQVGIDLETNSIAETLAVMCDAHAIEQLNDDVRTEGPQLGNFSDFGRVANDYGNRARRKHHYDPDTEAMRQMRITFGPDDAEQAEQEVKRDLNAELSTGHALDDDLEAQAGFRPFDQER